MSAKKNDSATVAAIASHLRRGRRFLVASHVRPDGDAVGGTLALALMLRARGKTVTAWNDDGLPARYSFLRGGHLLARTPAETAAPREFDVVLALDTANFKRLGRVGDLFRAPVLINIDHHESNERFGDLVWVRPDDAATCQMLFELFCAEQFPITPAVADALFVGIQTDTGSFRYSNASAAVFRAAAELIERGVHVGELGRLVYDTQPAARLRLLKRVLDGLKLTARNRVAYFWLTENMYRQSGAAREDTEDLIHYARSVDSVVVAALFEEIPGQGKIRISLRSKSPKINVSAIAAKFGGGGHAAAAGAMPEGNPKEIQRAVLAEIRRALEQNS